MAATITASTKLVASDQAANDFFGWSCAMSSDGNAVIVGAYSDDSPTSNAGSAYVFRYSAGVWDAGTKLVASDQAADDFFGLSCAMSSDGNAVIVGAYADDSPTSNAGSAYVFLLVAKITGNPLILGFGSA